MYLYFSKKKISIILISELLFSMILYKTIIKMHPQLLGASNAVTRCVTRITASNQVVSEIHPSSAKD